MRDSSSVLRGDLCLTAGRLIGEYGKNTRAYVEARIAELTLNGETIGAQAWSDILRIVDMLLETEIEDSPVTAP